MIQPLAKWGLDPDKDNIPTELKANYRWVAWEATPLKTGKIGKVPVCPRTGNRASTVNPDHWGTFEEAWARYLEGTARGACSGVGIILTGADLDVGDLDRQLGRDEGDVIALANAAIERAYGGPANTYAELSPSGRGIRVISKRLGERVASFSNTEKGIDYYSGDGGRFVTITGKTVFAAPIAHVDLEGILKHRPSPSTAAPAHPQPTIEPAQVPSDLSIEAQAWINYGEHIPKMDGNASALSVASSLYRRGLSDGQVLGLLASSTGGIAVAGAPHRRPGDPVGQADWLWRYVCTKARLQSPDRALDALPQLDPTEGTERDTPEDTKRHRYLGMDELRKGLKPPQWLIKPILERETLGILYGATGSRKSFVLLDILASIAAGVPWHGRQTHQGISIYICGEGTAGIAKRVEAWRRQHGHTGPLYVSRTAADISTPAGIQQIGKDIVECQRRAKREYGIDAIGAIGIDTLSQNAGGIDENSNSEIAQSLRGLARIRDAYHCTVILAHHVGHTANGRERGAYALRANVDFSIHCSLTGDESTKPLSRRTVLAPMKTKDGEAWQSVELAAEQYLFLDHVDFDGDPMTTLVLNEPSQAVVKALNAQQLADDTEVVVEWVEVHQGDAKTAIERECGIPRDRARAAVDHAVVTRRLWLHRGMRRTKLVFTYPEGEDESGGESALSLTDIL